MRLRPRLGSLVPLTSEDGKIVAASRQDRHSEENFRSARVAVFVTLVREQTIAMSEENNSDARDQMPSWREVFLYFLFLGFVNIGGPVAQITMMFNHMVEKRASLANERSLR